MTSVVSIRKKKGKKRPAYDVYCGRGSPYGNPYVIGNDGDRNQVIEKYREYFYKKIKSSPDFKEKILYLKDKVLGCYCHPLKCHCDVIKEYLDNL